MVNNKPIFGGQPLVTIKNVSVAYTSLTGVTAPADATNFRMVFSAGTNGGFVDAIDYQAVGTGTPGASIMNIWVTDTTGANALVNHMYTVAAGSAISTTVAGASVSNTLYFMNLAAGQAVYATFTALAANISYNVTAYAGQFTSQ